MTKHSSYPDHTVDLTSLCTLMHGRLARLEADLGALESKHTHPAHDPQVIFQLDSLREFMGGIIEHVASHGRTNLTVERLTKLQEEAEVRAAKLLRKSRRCTSNV